MKKTKKKLEMNMEESTMVGQVSLLYCWRREGWYVAKDKAKLD